MCNEDRSLSNEVGAKIYFKIIELYILTERYKISLEDKINESRKFKIKMKVINIYNFLF